MGRRAEQLLEHEGRKLVVSTAGTGVDRAVAGAA